MPVLASFLRTRTGAIVKKDIPKVRELADGPLTNVKAKTLRETLKANHHPAIGMWAIGNELNGAWNGWVGDPGDCAGPCLFGGDVALLYSSIDELCQVVVEWGKLCTTVLADVPVPRSVTLRTWTDDPCDRLLPKTAGLTAAEAARAKEEAARALSEREAREVAVRGWHDIDDGSAIGAARG